MNNNYQYNSNEYHGNNSNENNEAKVKILNIGLVLMLVVGVVFVINTMFLNNDDNSNQSEYNDNEKEDIQQDNQVEQEENANSQDIIVEEEVEEEPPVEQEEPKPTTNPTSLKCTKTFSNKYGKFVYTNTYKFKNKQMISGTIKIKATLNKSYYSYRDSLIQTFKEENKKFVKLDGFSESVDKRKDGFTYTFKLDASKLSKKELADMGYRTLNYSGVKIDAYNKGYKCEQ